MRSWRGPSMPSRAAQQGLEWGKAVMKNKLPNNEMVGYVINDKHPKSIRVACDRYMYVVRYKKTFRYTKKVWAHDEASEARLGDVVRIQPLGYRIGPWKNYLLVKILHREPRDEPQPEAERPSSLP